MASASKPLVRSLPASFNGAKTDSIHSHQSDASGRSFIIHRNESGTAPEAKESDRHQAPSIRLDRQMKVEDLQTVNADELRDILRVEDVIFESEITIDSKPMIGFLIGSSLYLITGHHHANYYLWTALKRRSRMDSLINAQKGNHYQPIDEQVASQLTNHLHLVDTVHDPRDTHSFHIRSYFAQKTKLDLKLDIVLHSKSLQSLSAVFQLGPDVMTNELKAVLVSGTATDDMIDFIFSDIPRVEFEHFDDRRCSTLSTSASHRVITLQQYWSNALLDHLNLRQMEYLEKSKYSKYSKRLRFERFDPSNGHRAMDYKLGSIRVIDLSAFAAVELVDESIDNETERGRERGTGTGTGFGFVIRNDSALTIPFITSSNNLRMEWITHIDCARNAVISLHAEEDEDDDDLKWDNQGIDRLEASDDDYRCDFQFAASSDKPPLFAPKIEFSTSFHLGDALDYWSTATGGVTGHCPQSQHRQHSGHHQHSLDQSHSVIPIYRTLKEELLNNRIARLSLSQYHRLYRCVMALRHKTGPVLCPRDYPRFGIYHNDPIGVNHLIAIRLYTDCREIARKFCRQCRRQNAEETLSQCIQRNAEIANWCRYLRECTLCWGQPLIDKKKQSLYLELSQKLLFDSMTLQFECPFTAVAQSRSIQSFFDDKGVVIQFKTTESFGCGDVPTFIDLGWVSQREEDAQKRFLYGSALRIYDIWIDGEWTKKWIAAIQYFEHLVSGHFVLNRRNETEGYLYALIAFHLKWDLSGNPPSYIAALFGNLCKVTKQRFGDHLLWINQHELYAIKHRKLQCALTGCGEFWKQIGIDLATTQKVQQFEWNMDHQDINALHHLHAMNVLHTVSHGNDGINAHSKSIQFINSMDSDLLEYRLSRDEVVTFWVRAHRVPPDNNNNDSIGDRNGNGNGDGDGGGVRKGKGHSNSFQLQQALSLHLDVESLPDHIESMLCECCLFCEYGKRHKIQIIMNHIRLSRKVQCSELKQCPTAKWKKRHSIRWKIGIKVLSTRSVSVSPPPPSAVSVPTGTDSSLYSSKVTAADIANAVEQKQTSKLINIFQSLVERTKQKEQEMKAMRSSINHYIQRSEDLQEELTQNRFFMEQMHRLGDSHDSNRNLNIDNIDHHHHHHQQHRINMEDGKEMERDHHHKAYLNRERDRDHRFNNHLDQHLNVPPVPAESETLSDGFDHGFYGSAPSGPSVSILNSRSHEIKDDDAGATLHNNHTVYVSDRNGRSPHSMEEDVVGVIYAELSDTKSDTDGMNNHDHHHGPNRLNLSAHNEKEVDHIKALQEDLGDVYVSSPYRLRVEVSPSPSPALNHHQQIQHQMDRVLMSPSTVTNTYRQYHTMSPREEMIANPSVSPSPVSISMHLQHHNNSDPDPPIHDHRYRIGTGLVEADNVHSAHSKSTELKLPEPNHYVLKTPPKASISNPGYEVIEPLLTTLIPDRGDSNTRDSTSYLAADFGGPFNSSPDTVTPTVCFVDDNDGVGGHHVMNHNGNGMGITGPIHHGLLDMVSTTKSITDSKVTEDPTHDMMDGAVDRDLDLDLDGIDGINELNEMNELKEDVPFILDPSATSDGTLLSRKMRIESNEVDSSEDQMEKHPVIRSRVLYDAGRWALNRSSDERSDSCFRSVDRNVILTPDPDTVSISTLDGNYEPQKMQKLKKQRKLQSGYQSNRMKSKLSKIQSNKRPPPPRHRKDKGLPPGWTTTRTPSGVVIYLNHKMEIAQFEHPGHTTPVNRGVAVTMQKSVDTKVSKSSKVGNASYDTARATAGSSLKHHNRIKMKRRRVKGRKMGNTPRVYK